MSQLANERVAWFNGDFVPEREVRIPFRDSSWVYGDGCFDMTRTFGHRLFKVKEHVDRLYESMRPDGCMLAFFNANEKAKEIPLYNYRITDQRTLTLVPRGTSAPAQYFNNRSIEKLFHRYSSVKFFLTRDHLREIIVRR